MASSLQEQLLKAGLATEESLKAKDTKKNNTSSNAPKGKKAHGKKPSNQKPNKPKQDQEPNLADLYRQRANLERKETEEEEKRKREMARIKKQNRKKLRDLVMGNLKNVEDASIRYNFLVGSNVKYVFVTEEQQTELSDGKLAITFIDGKRCIVPAELHNQIKELDPEKIVVIAEQEPSSEQ